jgi:hypothetical protein
MKLSSLKQLISLGRMDNQDFCPFICWQNGSAGSHLIKEGKRYGMLQRYCEPLLAVKHFTEKRIVQGDGGYRGAIRIRIQKMFDMNLPGI